MKRDPNKIVGITINPYTGLCEQITWADLSRMEREEAKEKKKQALEAKMQKKAEKEAKRAKSAKKVESNQILPHTKPELRLQKHNTEEPWRRKPEGNKRRGRG